MKTDWDNIQSFTQEALTRIKSTAMAPSLWLAGVVGVIFLTVSVVFTVQGATVLAALSFGVASVAAFTSIFTNIYFTIKDPDRLQSEEYVIRNRVMDIFGQKGKGFAIKDIDLGDLIESASPRDKRKINLSYEGKEKKLISSTSPTNIEQAFDSDFVEIEGDDDVE